MMTITPIPAFVDNYLWLITDSPPASSPQKAVIVDPGDAAPVIQALETNNLELEAILVTHWHKDHTGGINELLKYCNVPVYGPNSPHIPQVTNPLKNGEIVTLSTGSFQVITVPGHTLDHIAYYNAENHTLFCGDTLFSGGCGRMFEGTPEIFHKSLETLAQLPIQTQIFCTHEYTLANLQFSLAVEPTNPDIIEHINRAEIQQQKGEPTLPSVLSEELKINPFLRTNIETVIEQALNQGAQSSKPVDVFATLREWKNNF